jgi:hypothetical protein
VIVELDLGITDVESEWASWRERGVCTLLVVYKSILLVREKVPDMHGYRYGQPALRVDIAEDCVLGRDTAEYAWQNCQTPPESLGRSRAA